MEWRNLGLQFDLIFWLGVPLKLGDYCRDKLLWRFLQVLGDEVAQPEAFRIPRRERGGKNWLQFSVIEGRVNCDQAQGLSLKLPPNSAEEKWMLRFGGK